MPRDISGVYTLPAGNPVVNGTVIESAWANNTLSDIATQLNDVITRGGALGPTAPMKFADGTVALPSITFGSQPNLGIYRKTNDNLAVVTGGQSLAEFTAASLNVRTNLATDGNLTVAGKVTGDIAVDPAASPTAHYTFAGTGRGTNGLGYDSTDIFIVNQGSRRAMFPPTGPGITTPANVDITSGGNFNGGNFNGGRFVGTPGSATSPTYTFTGDSGLDTGIFSSGNGHVGVASNADTALALGGTTLGSTVHLYWPTTARDNLTVQGFTDLQKGVKAPSGISMSNVSGTITFDAALYNWAVISIAGATTISIVNQAPRQILNFLIGNLAGGGHSFNIPGARYTQGSNYNLSDGGITLVSTFLADGLGWITTAVPLQ